MARIRFYNDVFSNSYTESEYDFSKPLIQQIEESSSPDVYGKTYVECYDTETGETFFAPMEEDDSRSVIIVADGQIVGQDYIVEAEGLIEVIYLPSTWSGQGAAAGGFIGALFGAIIGFGLLAAGVVTGGTAWAAIGVLAAAGAAIGVVGGGIIGGLLNDLNKDKSSSYDNGSEDKSLPDVRGAENQSLVGNCYPFVIGKHLITPFIVGAPVTEYSGEKGKDAYISVLYCAGYSPLKLTEFKLGELLLAYNKDMGQQHPTVLGGMLKGYSTAESDDGPVLDYWNNNDISLEIIQPTNDTVPKSTLYPYVVKDQEIDANVMFVADNLLSSTAEVVYKGGTFPNRFRTNGVFFTASCPKKFTLNLAFPAGAYATYSYTKDSKTETKYDSIPLIFCIQYRLYNRNNPSSDPEGSDYSSWTNITTFNGKNLGFTFTPIAKAFDVLAHRGNKLDDFMIDGKEVKKKHDADSLIETLRNRTAGRADVNLMRAGTSGGLYYISPNKKVKIDVNGIELDNLYMTRNQIWSGYLFQGDTYSAVIIDVKTGTLYLGIDDMTVTSGGSAHNILLKETKSVTVMQVRQSSKIMGTNQLVLYSCRDVYSGDTSSSRSFSINQIKTVGNYYEVSNSQKSSLYGYFENKTLTSFSTFSGEKGRGEIRLSATVELTDEQCRQMLSPDNPTKSVEIRILRVSPNYIDQTGNEGNKEGQGAISFADALKVRSIVTTCFDEEYLRTAGQVRLMDCQTEEDREKFCYIALKAKADTAGNILSSLSSFSCMAESFSPYWDVGQKRLFPEGVEKRTEFYGYYNSSGEMISRGAYTKQKGSVETTVTKEEYEAARRQGFDWIEKKNGSNFFQLMNEIVFSNHLFSNDGRIFYASYAGLVTNDSRMQISAFGGNQITSTKPAYSVPSSIIQISDKEYVYGGTVFLPNYPTSLWLLSDSASRYNDASAVSGFVLACVGPHAGPMAIGYEDLNILSMGTAYEDTQEVSDGSVFTEPTVYKGKSYETGEPVVVRMEANAYVYQGVKMEDLLAKLAVCARAGFTYDRGGKIKLIVDKPADYYKDVVSLQNCISSSSAYNYTDLPAGLRLGFSDENDGYEQNALYCWSDGNTLGNHKGQVEDYQVPYVTDPYQGWLLGRYVLATRVLQRELLTVKIGPEGKVHELGDVILVQDEGLLIGNSSARIQETIEDNAYIYGFVTNSVYDYSYKPDEDGKNTLGVTVLQPEQYGQSRTVTLRISSPGVIYMLNGEKIREDEYDSLPPEYKELASVYTMTNGKTNVVIFDTPVKRTAKKGVYTVNAVYDFKTDDSCFFGEIDRITAPYKVIKLKPEASGQITETLISYNEELYSAGAELPTFNNYMTLPPVSKDFMTLNEVPTTLEEQNRRMENLLETIDLSNGIAETPGIPHSLTALATIDSIKMTCIAETGTQLKDTVAEFEWELVTKNGDIYKETTSNASWDYYFRRGIDGYPEGDELEQWKLRVRGKNVYGLYSEWSGYSYISASSSTYGTWLLQKPEVISDTTDRRIVLKIDQPARSDARTVYGNIRYRIRIKRNEVKKQGYDVEADTEWSCPATNANPYPTATASNEDNYKKAGDYITINGGTYVQTVPLYGQGIENGAVDTPYIYDIQAFNEAHTLGWLSESGEEIYVEALCTALRDVVMAKADYKRLYVGELSAITANLGEIRDGSLTGNDLNFWNLSTKPNASKPADYQGAFRVGGEDQYLEVIPVIDSGGNIDGYKVTLRAGNITLSGISGSQSLQETGTYIYDTTNTSRRMELTGYGINIQTHSDGPDDGRWATTGKVIIDNYNNLILTNEDDNDKLPQIVNFVPDDSSADIYHLETDTSDINARGTENEAGLTFDGAILPVSSEATVLFNDNGVFAGNIEKDFNGEQKALVFLTKSNQIEAGGNLVSMADGSVQTGTNDWNSRDKSTWGLTAGQSSAGLFKWR